MGIINGLLIAGTTLLVGALGWALGKTYSARVGALGSILLFGLHPIVFQPAWQVSAWDAFFLTLFFASWLWMEAWSLFMRSWILAGIYAFGLWLGSPFIWWIPIAMLPWITFCRRPVDGLVKLATIVIGGFVLFGSVWGVVAFFAPTHPPLPWQLGWRWNKPEWPHAACIPFFALGLEAVVLKLIDARREHRADTALAISLMLLITVLFGSPALRLALVGISAPLIAYTLLRREMMYQRMVRWIMGLTFLLTLGVALGRHAQPGWMMMGLIIFSGFAIRWVQKSSILSVRAAFEASCLGSAFAVSIGSVLASAMR